MKKNIYIYGAVYNLITNKIKLKKFSIQYEINFLLKNQKFIILKDFFKKQIVILKVNDRKITSIKKQDINTILNKLDKDLLLLN